jgi:hypothetical protein
LTISTTTTKKGRVTSNLEGAPLDDALCIEDEKTIRMVYTQHSCHRLCISPPLTTINNTTHKHANVQVFDIFNDEGLFLGASSSLNLCAAVEVAKSMKKGTTRQQRCVDLDVISSLWRRLRGSFVLNTLRQHNRHDCVRWRVPIPGIET